MFPTQVVVNTLPQANFFAHGHYEKSAASTELFQSKKDFVSSPANTNQASCCLLMSIVQ